MTRERVAALTIRSPHPGEYGWIIAEHGRFYAREFGWMEEFEAIVARIVVEYLEADDQARQACFIADLNGQPVGCVMLTENGAVEGKLRVLYVAEAARGRGAGTLLVRRTIAAAREFGFRALSLWTTDKQTVARKIYENCGFRRIGESPNQTFAPDSVDEVWQLEL